MKLKDILYKNYSDIKSEEKRFYTLYQEKFEINTCEKLINRVKKVSIPKQIVVVNDGSTDGSKEILMKIDGIELYHNSANLGKGNAVRLALKRCIGKYVILQDGDLEYDPSSYHQLLFPLISKKGFHHLDRDYLDLNYRLVMNFYYPILNLNYCHYSYYQAWSNWSYNLAKQFLLSIYPGLLLRLSIF